MSVSIVLIMLIMVEKTQSKQDRGWHHSLRNGFWTELFKSVKVSGAPAVYLNLPFSTLGYDVMWLASLRFLLDISIMMDLEA